MRYSRQRCPTLGNLYGTQVLLNSGQKVLFDEAYIRESILFPNAKVVAGYQPIMPTFRGQVTEEQILALIAYIKSLSPNQNMILANIVAVFLVRMIGRNLEA